MDVTGFLSHLRGLRSYKDQIAHLEDIPPRSPAYGRLDRPLNPALEAALRSAGISDLYSHQAEAINALGRGENIIVSTPAASGKSLCYHLPVLEALLEDRAAYAMYLFPAKALARDQARSFEKLIPESARLRFGVFDGDTPSEDRADVRRSSRLVLTNPDMLHVGILPNHRTWYHVLRGLRYVVIDEAHIYRGVFGSHVANVIRRLRRLCRRFGNEPQFILCSATTANPGEHAESLTGLPFTVIQDDGSPFGGKDFVFWNPPMIDLANGSRRSTNSEASAIFAELIRRRVRTLAFVRSRRAAELLYVYTRDKLMESDPTAADRISPYRASYLPEDRRRIERDLADGRLLGLSTTNAMELGIDIGDLEATVLTGYPGSIASSWQQAGRSGRRGQRALTMLLALDNPLDQYLMLHPEAFFGKPHESARISPTNPYVLKPQLLCAAYESPLDPDDADLFDTDISIEADELEEEGFLHSRAGRWHLDPQVTYPAQDVNIRSTSATSYTLVEEDSGVVLETVDEDSAFLQLHPGAVYLHQGQPFLISRLDLESKTAYAAKTDVPYYTEVRDYTETRVLRTFKQKRVAGTMAYLGEVAVTTTVVGFTKRAHFTSEPLGDEYVSLPPRSFNTVSLWFDVPPDTLGRIRDDGADLAGGLHATEHAAIGVLPIFALCDRNDIGGISTPLHPDTGRPQVFIHDGHPGGVGIAERGYDVIDELWRATLEVISACPCLSGCPSCIQSPKCGNNNQPLDKAVARLVLGEILAGQDRAAAEAVSHNP